MYVSCVEVLVMLKDIVQMSFASTAVSLVISPRYVRVPGKCVGVGVGMVVISLNKMAINCHVHSCDIV